MSVFLACCDKNDLNQKSELRNTKKINPKQKIASKILTGISHCPAKGPSMFLPVFKFLKFVNPSDAKTKF